MTKKLVFVVTLCAFAAAPALADTVQLQFKSASSPNSTISFYEPGQVNPVSVTVYATHYSFVLRQSGSNPYPVYLPAQYTTITSFCIDIGDDSVANGTWYDYSVVALKDAPDTWAGPMEAVRAARLTQLLDRYWGKAGTNDTALQIAVWEIIDEGRKDNSVPVLGDLNLTTGTFKATDPTGEAQGYLNKLTPDWTPQGKYAALTSTASQDFVVKVPVPAAALLGLLGLGAAGLKLRRFA